jgi:pimeloyl-ACP methyl ester carboxylesterase
MLNPTKTQCPPKKIVRILKYTCIVVFVLLCVGVAYQRIGDYVEMKTITPPGIMVDVEGHKMHLVCMGEVKKNRPTVILEAGAGGYWDSWNTIQSEIAKSTYVCSYDREGLGFSESTPTAHAAKDVAHQLDALLLVAHVPGPYLLVGHSLGGIYIR